MCGRYAASRSPEDLAGIFEIEVGVPPAGVQSSAWGRDPQETFAPDWNVAPTKQVYAVLSRPPVARHHPQQRPSGPPHSEDAAEPAPVRQLHRLKWGLVPSWAKTPEGGARMINARAETVHEKPSYRRAFAARRCILPADGYYEWYATEQRTKAGKPVKQPFFIRPRDGSVLAMAGLYEIWRDPTKPEDDPHPFLWSCTVITTDAPDDLGRIHDRMPLMVERERWADWLDPGRPGALDLLVPAAPGRLEAFPVSTRVNSADHNGPDLVEPLPVEELPPDVADEQGER